MTPPPNPTPAEVAKAIAELAELKQTVADLKVLVDEIKVSLTTLVESDQMKVLARLAESKLKVRIVSFKGLVLDNYYGRCDDGDGERTVQFQNDLPGNPALDMTLRLV